MARLIKFADSEIKTALIENKGLIYLAAKSLGCNQSTIHRRLQKNPKLRAVVERERGELLDTAERSLIEAVERGESWAVCFLLKTLGRGRGYSQKTEVVQQVVQRPLDDLSDAELARIIKDATEILGDPEEESGHSANP